MVLGHGDLLGAECFAVQRRPKPKHYLWNFLCFLLLQVNLIAGNGWQMVHDIILFDQPTKCFMVIMVRFIARSSHRFGGCLFRLMLWGWLGDYSWIECKPGIIC